MSKRIKNFCLVIAKGIPKFPNDKTTLQILKDKSLGALLVDYANWAIRYIAPRPREVIVELTAKSDPRWSSLAEAIQPLLVKIEKGEDLTPYLSLQPHTRGFTPAASLQEPDVDRWADKDMLLNVMGYHHLHLDAAPTNKMRSDDMLFAYVTRDTFTVVGIFNHAVFKETMPNAAMTAERERLWQIFDERSKRDIEPGSIIIPSIIASSGHALDIVFTAMNYAKVVSEIDPKLDDPAYVRGLYKKVGVPIPAKPKVKWQLNYLDLGLIDEAAGVFFILRKGAN